MVPKILLALGALLLMTACRLPGSPPSCNAQIEWVNFIEVGSTQYVAGPPAPTAPPVADRASGDRPRASLYPCQVQGERQRLRPRLPAQGWGRGVPGCRNADLRGPETITHRVAR